MRDIFFSYRRHDLDRARPLLSALDQAGISVWRDELDLAEQASITSEIRQAIANCRAFLAFYSPTYPQSNPCQEEIRTAWLAAEQIGEPTNGRVWIVNPEKNFEHIPELFRDQQAGVAGPETVPKVKRALDALDTTVLGSGMRALPAFHGMAPVQANRFAGRAKEFWDLHAKLTANRISIMTGIYGRLPHKCVGSEAMESRY